MHGAYNGRKTGKIKEYNADTIITRWMLMVRLDRLYSAALTEHRWQKKCVISSARCRSQHALQLRSRNVYIGEEGGDRSTGSKLVKCEEVWQMVGR